eukprot:scaffold38189_cov28-Tisochrysis_lutea.AAC.1
MVHVPATACNTIHITTTLQACTIVACAPRHRGTAPPPSHLRRGERFALEVADACCEGGAAARGKADERAEYMGARLPHSPGDLDIQSSVGCALVLVRSGEGIAVAGRADGGGTAPAWEAA